MAQQHMNSARPREQTCGCGMAMTPTGTPAETEEPYSADEVASVVASALGTQAWGLATALQLGGHRRLCQLGGALLGCHSLTTLDLSRCGLTTLDGLQALLALRQLGLYYNSIADLAEMHRLGNHPQLETLDLRLNPVTRAGARYRLNVLRAAPGLRTLDAREVSGLERHRATPPHAAHAARTPADADGGAAGDDAIGGTASLVAALTGTDAPLSMADSPDPGADFEYVERDDGAPAETAVTAEAAEEDERTMFDQILLAQRMHAEAEGAFEESLGPAVAEEGTSPAPAPPEPSGAVEEIPEEIADPPSRPDSPTEPPMRAETPAQPAAPAAGPPAPPLVPVGPTMSAAIAAAEERWAAERRGLENEVAWLRKQKLEDARVLQQTASLVQMLQEAHRALVSSNEQLLAQVRRLRTHPMYRRERHTWGGWAGGRGMHGRALRLRPRHAAPVE